MPKPRFSSDSRVCLVETSDELLLYANTGALRSFAKLLVWVAKSEVREHFEIHLVWDLLSVDEDPNKSTKFCSIRDKTWNEDYVKPFGYEQREMTLMHLKEEEIELLFLLASAYNGNVPISWTEATGDSLRKLLKE